MDSPPLRTLIVDDEPVARRILAEELEDIADVMVIGEAENGEQALERIESESPDLVLLDIQMPVLDGFEVLRRLRGRLPAVIFVTAFSEHALRAFEVGAVDYLLKPVTGERLRQAVERAAASRSRPAEAANRVAKTLEAANAGAPRRSMRVVARRGQDYYLLDLDEVYAFQADGELTWILTGDKKYLATQTLQALEDRLGGNQFQRVHRGALVNLDKIRKMSGLSSQRWLLTLANGLEFTVSKRQAPLVRGILR